MKKIALVLTLAVTLAACKTNKQYNKGVADAQASGYASGMSDGEAKAIKTANFIAAIQQGSTTTSYTLVKFAQDNANIAVIKMTNGGPAVYIAVDISNYVTGVSPIAYIISGAAIFVNLTNNGNGTFSCNAGTCSNMSGPTSSTMVFEKTAGSAKDMDKAAAFAEAYAVETNAAHIAAEFGLSDERSIKVAKLAASWEKLAKSRALTDADADAFSRELTGVSITDMENAEKAMMGGSMSELKSVLDRAAEVNGTTSENMAAIMTKLFN